jgi:hypothetical protein
MGFFFFDTWQALIPPRDHPAHMCPSLMSIFPARSVLHAELVRIGTVTFCSTDDSGPPLYDSYENFETN